MSSSECVEHTRVCVSVCIKGACVRVWGYDCELYITCERDCVGVCGRRCVNCVSIRMLSK